ncbi:DNA repair protein RadA [Poriferisphaera sp. WC338]|uniref:DNA repair protein RadA n=1 Tax=Poriferisphaera sp. WC338 TaxID=3425129 RepID=UPI003D815F1F
MAKVKTQFMCDECGATQPKWMGKCPDCGAWDSLVEFKEAKGAGMDEQRGVAGNVWGAGVGPVDEGGPKAALVNEIEEDDEVTERLSTGIFELDRVLGGVDLFDAGHGQDGGDSAGDELEAALVGGGVSVKQKKKKIREATTSRGGLVPGSAVLVGGDPGIGKSTLLLQAAHKLAAGGTKVLYVTSEESQQQLKLRAERLGAGSETLGGMYVLADTNLARIVEQARKIKPGVVVIDSIQMIYKGDMTAAPGSVTQLRACCLELVYFAKASGTALLLVGHVTKQGRLAGPRLLEHMVDTVLYFEGDRYHSHRVVRGIKNRFGTTLEVGLFEMTDGGLKEVNGGGGLLAGEYEARSGSVVCPVLQGSRCLMVEMQALTSTGFLGSTKRKVSGLDGNRLAMLIAVLEKRGGLRLADQDIFASSVGGMRVAEPASDLALALAIAGGFLNKTLEGGWCAVGEIGLGGEVRHVQQIEQRVIEASRLGFRKIICPRTKMNVPSGAELVQVGSVSEAMQVLG